MQDFINIVNANINPNGGIGYRGFQAQLKFSSHYEPFMALHKLHGLPWRASQYIYINGSRPTCLMCSNYTSFQCRGLGFFSKYCSPICQNNCPLKIVKQNDGATETAKRRAATVVKVLTTYKNVPILKLTTEQILEFNKVINSLKNTINATNATEFNILKHLNTEYRKLWANLPTKKARTRLLMATGAITITANCAKCGKGLIEPKFHWWCEYCSLKCSNQVVAKERNIKSGIMEILRLRKVELCKDPKYRKFLGLRLKNNMLKKYGVVNSSQIPEFRTKAINTMLFRKKYQLGTKEVTVQGYEPKALDYLLQYLNAEDIEVES